VDYVTTIIETLNTRLIPRDVEEKCAVKNCGGACKECNNNNNFFHKASPQHPCIK
jgi:hypothetical protein